MAFILAFSAASLNTLEVENKVVHMLN
jgi:hypothetical protein